jgi:hypothetical protein
MTTNNRRDFIFKSTMLAASGVLTACGGGFGEDQAAAGSAASDPAAAAVPDTQIAATSVEVPNSTALPNAVFRLSPTSTLRAAPYCLGYAFRQGDVPAGKVVTGDTGAIQVVPKNLWPDGSLKFAVIAGLADVTAGTDTKVGLLVSPAPATTPTPMKTAKLRATEIVATIGCGAFGIVTWSGADWDAPFDSWVSGPTMSSWIYRKPVGSDKHLVAWLEVRLWSSGAVEVLPWIENGYLKVAGPTNKSAAFTFALGKTQRMSAAIDLKHHQRTPLVSGTALSYWLSTAPGVTPLHDAAYLQASELVPTYSAVVPVGGSAISVLPSTFTPLQQARFNYDNDSMPSPGYQSPIGLLPEHDVLHLVANSADRVKTYNSVIWHGFSAGRYGLHYRDEATQRPPAFSTYPTLVFADGSGFKDTGASTTSTYTPTPTGGNAPTWDTSHSPSVGYMAYLLTGRFYFKEEVQFAAISNHFNVTDWVRGGGRNGVYTPRPGFTNASGICVTAVQTRAGAWWFRTLAQALAVTPDAGDPLRPELVATVEANCNYYHQVYVAQPNNPFGVVEEPYPSYGNIPGVCTIPGWQQDFFTAAWGMALSFDLPISSAAKTKMAAFFQWKAKSIVGRLDTSAGWWYVNASPYVMPISTTVPPDYYGGTGPWYPNFKAAYDVMAANYVDSGGAPFGTVEGTLAMYFPEASQPSMWHNLQPALAYAVRHGAAGAQAAYDRMITASNWSAIGDVFNGRPVWSVKPAGVIPAVPTIFAPVQPAPPAWLAGRALNEWHEIPGANSAVNIPVNSPPLDKYCGWVLVGNKIYSPLPGGHTDSSYNGTVAIDLSLDSPAWVEVNPPSASSNVVTPAAYYLDGKPTSRHTRFNGQYFPSLNRILMLGARDTYGGAAASFPTVDGFNLTTNQWDPAGTYPDVMNGAVNGGAYLDPQGNGWVAGFKFDKVTKTWSAPITSYAPNGVRYPWATSIARNLVFGMCRGNGWGGAGLTALIQVGNAQTQITFNSSAALTQLLADNTAFEAGMAYDEINDYFLFSAGRGDGCIYKIIPNSTAVWDMQIFSYGSGSVTPAAAIGGVQSKFTYIPAYKGFLYLPSATSNLMFMRTS